MINYIKDYKRMHEIVEKNTRLSWEGWTVLESIKNPSAANRVNGVFMDGAWYTQNRFEAGAQGWGIPTKYVR